MGGGLGLVLVEELVGGLGVDVQVLLVLGECSHLFIT